MTHPCCSPCRVRFTREVGIAPDACPRCGRLTERLPAADVLGFDLFEIADPERSLPAAIASALAHPRPSPARS